MATSSGTVMRAMVLSRLGPIMPGSRPLEATMLPVPAPGAGEIRLRVLTCGVCHTELDEIEGRTPPARLPLVPGHQIVGRVDALGAGCSRHALGARVGVGWIYHSSGARDENLAPEFTATGRDADGGYAEYMIVSEAYAYPIPAVFSDAEAAPLLCAGAIGYRALRLCCLSDGARLGLTGFGGSAHLVLQLARHLYPASEIYVFARKAGVRRFARACGADWAGPGDARAPHACDAIIDTTPAWQPVLDALSNLRPGGRLVINAIRKEDADKAALAQLSYHEHLWLEREIKSVANITAADITAFLALAAAVPIRPQIQTYPLADANRALVELRHAQTQGAKVLIVAADATADRP